MKKTLVLGASTDVARYSNIATLRLLAQGHEVVPVGIKIGKINELDILQGTPIVENIDTITLYLNPTHQIAYYDYILSLHPKRVIFNPGTENAELAALLHQQEVEVEIACTLVLLATGEY
jgi:predicted CoA-binding protein